MEIRSTGTQFPGLLTTKQLDLVDLVSGRARRAAAASLSELGGEDDSAYHPWSRERDARGSPIARLSSNIATGHA